jgi:hypothetical protein
MKKYKDRFKTVVACLILTTAVGCNSGDSTTTKGDSSQAFPGTDDSVPSIVNPGAMDTTSTMKTPATNDNNSIMPDSTTVAQ